jgi:nitrite reductase (NO-forming)
MALYLALIFPDSPLAVEAGEMVGSGHGLAGAAGDSASSTVTGRRGWLGGSDLRPTKTFLLVYLAVGLLLAEGLVGLVLVTGGASLLRPGAPATSTGVPVPNGPPVTFELKAFMTGYVGVNGSIQGVKDPTLSVGWGDHITLIVVDGEAAQHDLHLDGYNLQTKWLTAIGQSDQLVFQASQQGSFYYYCTFPGHRQAGMQGLFVVGPATNPIGPEANLTTPLISHNVTGIPPPITRNSSATVNIYLGAQEATAEIEPGVSFTYWTYNGTVPGPFFRVRVGDTVVVHFYNSPTSMMNHSVDFHAVTGPGGGAAVTQTAPGHWSNFTFLAMTPGLFVYHCGSPNIPTHIAMGMYGMILVQPPQGLPPIDHEFYLMEGELYLQWPIHTLGNQLFNGTALLNFDPTYVVFGGRYDAYTGSRALRVSVNDSVRIFFGEAGPNLYSAFHMIGSMFDRTYLYGDLTDPPLHNLQTVPVPPGSTAMMEFNATYPGNYPLVDHQIANAIDKGAYAILNVTGWANSSIFHRGAGSIPSTSFFESRGVTGPSVLVASWKTSD